MELKPGYKQTEVGVIPEDWDVCSLNDLSTMKSGVSITSANIDQYSKFPCYGGNGLRGYTTQYTHDGAYALIGRQGALCGNVLRVDGQFFASEHAIVVTPLQRTDINWLTFVLGVMHLNRYSESSAQPGLSVSKIQKLTVATPSVITEQTAIANALSDADALIQSLTRLIAKKRQIKQGAMQTLLNPYENGRLKAGWVVKKLGDIFESIQLGGNYANSEVGTDFPLIKMGNLGRGVINLAKIEYIKPEIAVAEKDRLIRGDVLFNTRNTLELVGKVAIWLDELPSAYFNSNIMRLKFKSNFVSSNVYMNSLLNHQRQIQQLKGMATGTTSVAAIYTRDLIGLEIPLAPKIEQTRIATILSGMDAEIAALETKLAKYRQIKQGMMQNLLTGRIRLVKPESKTGAVA